MRRGKPVATDLSKLHATPNAGVSAYGLIAPVVPQEVRQELRDYCIKLKGLGLYRQAYAIQGALAELR